MRENYLRKANRLLLSSSPVQVRTELRNFWTKGRGIEPSLVLEVEARIEKKHLMHLPGLQVDFLESATERGFLITHPDA